jgi:hypothetical protein
MPIMIWIAIIIMLALEHWIDFAILMAIQFINAFLGWCVCVWSGFVFLPLCARDTSKHAFSHIRA